MITGRTVADRFGLHTTDLECLDLIYLHGPIAAGELSKATGLTTGATTALIDRLEEAGYVERIAHKTDRRVRLVRINADAIKPIMAVYMPMQKRMFALWSEFDAADLEVIVDFVARSTQLQAACAAEINQAMPVEPIRPKRKK